MTQEKFLKSAFLRAIRENATMNKRKKEKDSVYREKIAYAARLYRKALAMSTVNSFVEALKTAAEAYKTLEELRLKFGEDEYDHAPETVNCDFVHYLIVKYKDSNRADSPEIFQNEKLVLDSWEWDVEENDFDYEG